ncbi:MAG TPA: o-succinylbenzoate synthase [Longimicrobiales bacterium]|nr:o-succinylbenzoate synthase [Longimicrobiales bacterium]
MNVRQIILREIRLPLREPFRISTGTMHHRRIVLAELRDGDGHTAWGECVAAEEPNYSPETVDTAWHALRHWFAPRLIGVQLPAPEAAFAALCHHVHGHRMAMATLEMAVWALFAVRDGISLARRLGGVRGVIDVGISLGVQDSPEILADRAADAVAAGYRRVKLKIGPGADIAYVEAVRRRTGDGAPLMVDANNAYTLDDADLLARLDDFGLMMIEQPLDAEDLVRHAALQRRLRTPLCLDESITSLERAEDMMTLGSGRIINIKAGRVGGLAQAVAIHDACARRDVPVWCGGMLETGIGRAYNVALASLPNFSIPGDVSPSARYWEKDIVTPEWTTCEPGRIAVPTGRPGLGVDVDMDRIDGLTVREEVLFGD